MDKIIYIMGTGRSATTLLEIFIANNPDVTGAGEVTHIFRDGINQNAICSCGKNALVCPLWGKVLAKLKVVENSTQNYEELFRKIDWHFGFFRNVLNGFNLEEKSEYETMNRKIFDLVSSISGCRVIVDSSKYAGRAIALSKIFPDKVKVICLTRSPIGLIEAFKRKDAEEQKPKRLIATFFYFLYVLICCRIAVNIIGRKNSTFVTYEQLIQNPYEVLADIEKVSGIQLRTVQEKIKKNEFLKIDHIVTGNRLRKRGKIKFNPNIKTNIPDGFLERMAALSMGIFGRVIGFKY